MMTPVKVLLNWILTVVLGSFLVPLAIAVYLMSLSEFQPNDVSDMFIFMPIFMLVSALCSLPALIVMMISAYVINKKPLQKSRKIFWISAIHFTCALLTMIIGYLCIKWDSPYADDDAIQFALITCWYLLVAAVIWLFSFVKLRKEK